MGPASQPKVDQEVKWAVGEGGGQAVPTQPRGVTVP